MSAYSLGVRSGPVNDGSPARNTSRHRSQRLVVALICGVALVLLCVSYVTRLPIIDEGWIAIPAYNLAQHGIYGSPVTPPTGTWLTQPLTHIESRTYWFLPGYPLYLAGWYFAGVPFDRIATRSLNTLWALLLLLAVLKLTDIVFKNRRISIMTSVLLLSDPIFLSISADVRPDAMCAALGYASIFAFLRTNSLSISSWLLAASMITHPYGALYMVPILALYWRQRKSPPTIAKLVWSALPFLIFFGGYALYASSDLPGFIEQMRANAATPTRLARVSWIDIVFREIGRFTFFHGTGGIFSPEIGMPATLVPLFIIAIGFLSCVQFANRNTWWILLSLIICAIVFLIDRHKSHHYVIHLWPWLCLSASCVISKCLDNADMGIQTLGIVTLLLMLCGNVSVIYKSALQSQLSMLHVPAAQKALQLSKYGTLCAPATFAFDLPLNSFVDDVRITSRSGVPCDYLVIDMFWKSYYRTHLQDINVYINTHYTLMHESTRYSFYELTTGEAYRRVVP